MQTRQQRVAFCVAILQQDRPELAGVVESWSDLPDAVKGGILAMDSAAKS